MKSWCNIDLATVCGVVLLSFIDLNSFPKGSPNETVLGISLTAKFSDSNHVLVGWTENSTQVSTCVYPQVYLQRDVCLWKLLILCLYNKKLMVISMIDSLLAADRVIPCRVCGIKWVHHCDQKCHWSSAERWRALHFWWVLPNWLWSWLRIPVIFARATCPGKLQYRLMYTFNWLLFWKLISSQSISINYFNSTLCTSQ